MSRVFLTSLLLAGLPLASFAAVDSGLMTLAPANSQIVASIDCDGSRSSAFGQFLLNQMSAHESDLQQLVAQTGFDPRRDVQSLVFAITPSQSPKLPGSFAVLARGSFDQNRIKAAAQKDGSTLQQFQGVDVMVKTNGNKTFAFAFPDAGLAVAGDLASVQQIITNRSQPTQLDPVLQNQISQVEANGAWFASIVPVSSLTSKANPQSSGTVNRAQILQSIVQSDGGIDFLSDSDVVFNAETRSPQDANALADGIRFLASMAQMQNSNTGQSTPLGVALAGMQLNVTGSAVHLSVHLPEAALEQLAAMQQGKHAHGATAHQ